MNIISPYGFMQGNPDAAWRVIWNIALAMMDESASPDGQTCPGLARHAAALYITAWQLMPAELQPLQTEWISQLADKHQLPNPTAQPADENGS